MDLNNENKKDIIIRELETMSRKEAALKNLYKVRAYRKVIEQIRLLPQVTDYEDLDHVKGIGPKIQSKIQEILLTGKLKAAERALQTGELSHYEPFLKIYGIGIAKAKELVHIHKITSINDLQLALKKNPSLLNSQQTSGLTYYFDLQKRIPRSEMEKYNKKLLKLSKDIDDNLELKMVGSYRRGTTESGDIDILLTVQNVIPSEIRSNILKSFVDKLKKHKVILADLASGSKKYMGICQLNSKSPARRIDILMTSQQEFPFALLYFTGDFNINIELRKQANQMGYTLNEYHLISNTNKIPVQLSSEKQIFNFLGFGFLKPKDRSLSNLKQMKK